MDAWTITKYWYLTKVNPQINEKKFYAVYVMVETATGKYYSGAQYGRIGLEQTGGTFRKVSYAGTEELATFEAGKVVSAKMSKGYSMGTVTAATVLVAGPIGNRFHLKRPGESSQKTPSQVPVQPPVAQEVPAMIQALWLATEVDGNAIAHYSLIRGDGWLIPYRRECVFTELVQKPMFEVPRNERGVAEVRCIVEHPGGGAQPSVKAIAQVLSYEPGEQKLHLCSFDQLRSL